MARRWPELNPTKAQRDAAVAAFAEGAPARTLREVAEDAASRLKRKKPKETKGK